MTGRSYATSAELAGEVGRFHAMQKIAPPCCRLCAITVWPPMANQTTMKGCLFFLYRLITKTALKQTLITHAKKAWDEALELGEKHGYRNAQATVIAPTGTIGLVMDCDTTGIEPDFAIVKFKKLAGGGYFKIINRVVPEALTRLGYSESQIEDISRYAVGHGNLESCQAISLNALKDKGFTDAILTQLAGSLENAFDIKFAFIAIRWAMILQGHTWLFR